MTAPLVVPLDLLRPGAAAGAREPRAGPPLKKKIDAKRAPAPKRQAAVERRPRPTAGGGFDVALRWP
jgi:hypothetical protein